MKTCPNCGIIPGEALKVKTHKTRYCRVCFKDYQKETKARWYAKNGYKSRVKPVTIKCSVCHNTFETNRSNRTTCSPICKTIQKARNKTQAKNFIPLEQYMMERDISRDSIMYHIRAENVIGYQKNKQWWVQDKSVPQNKRRKGDVSVK